MDSDHIIAHPRRGLLHLAGRAWRALAARAGSPCPACGGAARGGALCEPCAAEARAPMHQLPRCRRCALRLDVAHAWLAGRNLPGARPAECVDCRLHPPAFAQAVAAFDYVEPYDALILRFKSQRRHVLAGTLAQLLHQALRESAPLAGGPLHALVPIPASRASLRRRGFNPAGELAAALAGRLQTRLLRTALRRRREDGARQAALGRRARQAAAHELYRCVRPLAGLHVGLVDDVMTTGSTADAAARALLAAGAARVTVLVAARTPDD